MNKQELLEKYSDEEKILLAKIIDKIEFTKTKNKISYTDFLDEHEQAISIQLLNKIKNSNYILYGGIENAERKILVIYPEKLCNLIKTEVLNKNEYIIPIRINLPKQLYDTYNHRDYLGALMKLGIKREKIGDIIVYRRRCRYNYNA